MGKVKKEIIVSPETKKLVRMLLASFVRLLLDFLRKMLIPL